MGSSITHDESDHYDDRYKSPSLANHITQIETSKLLPMMIVLALLSGTAIGMSIMAIVVSQNARRDSDAKEQETRLLEYYVMELDGKLMASGAIEPNRSWSAQKRQKESK